MSETNLKLEIDGLSQLQVAELKSVLADINQDCLIEKDTHPLSGESHGEPTLVSIVLHITPLVISALALWLSKQKKRRTAKLRYKKVDEKIGRIETIEFDHSSYEEGESSASSIEAFFNGNFGHN